MGEAHAHNAGMQRAQQMFFGGLFPDSDYEVGYCGPIVCRVAGITYRQLGCWDRTDLVLLSIRNVHSSGSQHLYLFRDTPMLGIAKYLLDAGVSPQQTRFAVTQLESHGVEDLARTTLMPDGASIYECTSDDKVVDLVKDGQRVFGIAVGCAWREIEGTLGELPMERAEEAGAVVMEDKLVKRHATKRRKA